MDADRTPSAAKKLLSEELIEERREEQRRENEQDAASDSGLAGTTATGRTEGTEAGVAPGKSQDARPGDPSKVGEARFARPWRFRFPLRWFFYCASCTTHPMHPWFAGARWHVIPSWCWRPSRPPKELRWRP